MAIINKSTNNKRWRGCGKKETLVHCWWEYRLIKPLWSMKMPQKIKNRIAIQSRNATSVYLSKENKNTNSKRYMHHMFITALFIITENMEAT